MALTLCNKTNTSTLLMLIADNQFEYEEWFNAFYKMIHLENCDGLSLNYQQYLKVDKENEQMDALLNAILDAAVISDTLGTILAVNESMTTVFGYKREELIGQNVKILMPSHLARIHDEYLQRYLRRRDKRLIGKSRNVLGKRADGVTFPVEISLGEMSNTSLESMKPAYIAVFRSKTFESSLDDQEEKEPTRLHKSWTVAAFQDEERTDSESSQSTSSCYSNVADENTYLDYDDPDVPYHNHVQQESWLNQRTCLNLQYGHLINNSQQSQHHHHESHSPLSSSPSSNTSSSSSVTSNEDALDLFHSSTTSNMILKNLQFSDFSNYELQQNLTRIRLNKKRMKQQGDHLKAAMDDILNSEFSSLRVKLMLIKHQVQTLEEENQVLQKQMDNQYESLMMKELELGILENGSSTDDYYWKRLIKDKNIFEDLKRIANKERQLAMIQFLSRSFKYEEMFTVHTQSKEERKTSQNRYMRIEAETICEKFFGIRAISDQDDPQTLAHAQSMPSIDQATVDCKSRKQSTTSIARIMLSSKCEDLLKSHLLFPTPQIFDMANREIMERLKRKTLQQYLLAQHISGSSMNDLIDTIID